MQCLETVEEKVEIEQRRLRKLLQPVPQHLKNEMLYEDLILVLLNGIVTENFPFSIVQPVSVAAGTCVGLLALVVVNFEYRR